MTAEDFPYPRHGAFWRCGYRIERLPDDVWKFEKVRIRKGEWQFMLDPWIFDHMSDQEFAHVVGQTYRQTAFDQLEQDLATLAWAVLWQNCEVADRPPSHEVKAALRRYKAAQECP